MTSRPSQLQEPDVSRGVSRERTGERFKCSKDACDQRVVCAFYCWWRPTMAALNHERDQYRTSR